MGQEQYKSGSKMDMEEKTPPIEKDRAIVSKFDERIKNNPATDWKGKPSPASRPT